MTNNQKNAFSMVELLVVMTILGILFTLAAVSFMGAGSGLSLSQVGEQIGVEIRRARQIATAKSIAVEVRFYDLATDEDDDYVSVIQIVEQLSDGGYQAENPIRFPSDIGIVRDSELTSFFAANATDVLIQGTAGDTLPNEQEATYIAFRFRPDGSTNLTDERWFLTATHKAVTESSGGGIPDNFYTIQVDPVLGQITSYRP